MKTHLFHSISISFCFFYFSGREREHRFLPLLSAKFRHNQGEGLCVRGYVCVCMCACACVCVRGVAHLIYILRTQHTHTHTHNTNTQTLPEVTQVHRRRREHREQNSMASTGKSKGQSTLHPAIQCISMGQQEHITEMGSPSRNTS